MEKCDEGLRLRETARRKALWALDSIRPGDPKALPLLDILREIEQSEQADFPLSSSLLSTQLVLALVPTEPHPIGYDIVRESSIPQPWRERFIRASIGSTHVEEGFYAHDWQSFMTRWQGEMEHVEKHRAAIRG
jgi:hypothetical protein